MASSSTPSRLVVYADDMILTAGALRFLSELDQFELFAAGHSLSELIPFVESVRPDVILIHLTAEMTVAFLSVLREIAPNSCLILWGRTFSEELEWQARQIGVAGFISRGITQDEFVNSLVELAGGVAAPAAAEIPDYSTTVNLTARESQLVSLLAQGLKNKEIASCLNITEGTVRVYLSKLFAKIGARDRFETAVFGLKNVYFGQASWDGKNGFVTERDDDRARPVLKSLVLVEPQRRRGYGRRETAVAQ